MTGAAAGSAPMSSSSSPSPPLRDPLVGTDFRCLGLLAESATSVVLDAAHPRFGRVVVKLLQPCHRDRHDLIRRLAREAAVLRRLTDPRVVRLFDIGLTSENRPFLVFERVFGSTFAEEVAARRRLPVPEAVHLVCNVLAVLDGAHRLGVLHRDIKPSNLMACYGPGGPPSVKVLDFGIARIDAGSPMLDATWPYEALTEPHTLIGTPRYASPEQVRGQLVDARSDLYSAALVLYFLLAGRGPWDEHVNAADAMRAQIFLPPPPLAAIGVPVGPALEAVMRRGLEKSPEARFSSAAVFAEALFAGLLEAPRSGAADLCRVGRPPAPVDEVAESTAVTAVTETGWPPETRGAVIP